MIRAALSLVFVGWLLTSASHAQTLKQELDDLIQKTLPYATVGVSIKDAQSGEVIYRHNANKLLKPASNMKLLTAAAALYYLGPRDRYETSLAQLGDHFYMVFSGSPSFTTAHLNQLLESFVTLGIAHIKGNIVLDSSQFKAPFYAPGSSYDDLGWYYDAPSTAIILNGNSVAYDFISGKRIGKPVEIKERGLEHPLSIINDLISVSKTEEKEHCQLHMDSKPNNTLHLYGCLSQEKAPRRMRLAIPNPSLYVKQMIKAFLVAHHIVLDGDVRDGVKPSQAKTIAVHHSEDLLPLITFMLKESDNLYADSLTKRLGFFITKEGTYQQGVFAIKQILARHTHLDLKLLDMSDGHGTRYNMMTPDQLSVLLADLYQDNKRRSLFLSALPCFGVSGTLKARMKDTVLENKVCAKTGSMHDISALSGYMTIAPEKTILFSIISNGINTPLLKAKELEEKILLAVFSSYQSRDESASR